LQTIVTSSNKKLQIKSGASSIQTEGGELLAALASPWVTTFASLGTCSKEILIKPQAKW
jgi:hypothetical protein